MITPEQKQKLDETEQKRIQLFQKMDAGERFAYFFKNLKWRFFDRYLDIADLKKKGYWQNYNEYERMCIVPKNLPILLIEDIKKRLYPNGVLNDVVAKFKVDQEVYFCGDKAYITHVSPCQDQKGRIQYYLYCLGREKDISEFSSVGESCIQTIEEK